MKNFIKHLRCKADVLKKQKSTFVVGMYLSKYITKHNEIEINQHYLSNYSEIGDD